MRQDYHPEHVCFASCLADVCGLWWAEKLAGLNEIKQKGKSKEQSEIILHFGGPQRWPAAGKSSGIQFLAQHKTSTENSILLSLPLLFEQ